MARPQPRNIDGLRGVIVRLTRLVWLKAEVDFHIRDFQATARRLSERAFIHLQRTIVADDFEGDKWRKTFKKGEPACEKLGATHLLLHGIWAFKISATGEETDLVFDEPIRKLDEIERSSEALVLTEWKRADNSSDVKGKIADAKRQASRYASGSLGGLELAQYRYIVVVTKKVERMPIDDHVSDIIYRHINIAVDPDTPSKK